MKNKLNIVSNFCKSLLPMVLFLLVIVLLCKQLHISESLLSLYKAILPIVTGIVISFLLQPFIDKLSKYMKVNRAVMLVYMGVFVLLCIFLIILLPLLYQQISELLYLLPKLFTNIRSFFEQYLSSVNVQSFIDKQDIKKLYDGIFSQIQGMVSTTVFFSIAYVSAFFISIDLSFWKKVIHKTIPVHKRYYTFYHTFSSVVFQYLTGTIIDMLFIAISSFIVLFLFHFPNAFLYSVLLAFLNLFPYIGATIGIVLIGIIALLEYSSFPWVLFIVIFILQQIEGNLVQPMIFHKTMHVRPLLTFVFLFIMEAIFGIFGALLSPIAAAMTQIAIRSWMHSKTNDSIGKWEDIWIDFDEAVASEKSR